MTFKAGDRVSVEGVVEYDQKSPDGMDIFIRIDGDYRSVILDPDKVTMVQAKFNVGETVRGDDGEVACIGDIVAIDGDSAWVRSPQGYSGVFKLKQMDRMATETPATDHIEQPV